MEIRTFRSVPTIEQWSARLPISVRDPFLDRRDARNPIPAAHADCPSCGGQMTVRLHQHYRENLEAQIRNQFSGEALAALQDVLRNQPEIVHHVSYDCACGLLQKVQRHEIALPWFWNPQAKNKRRDPKDQNQPGLFDAPDTEQLTVKANTLAILGQFVEFNDKCLACCPLPDHNDSTPSFGYFQKSGSNTTLLHCFGCGWSGSIIKLIQQLEYLDYHDAIDRCFAILDGEDVDFVVKKVSQTRLRSRGQSHLQEVCRYDYTDAHGEVLFQVARREGVVDGKREKTFLIYRIVGGKPIAGAPTDGIHRRILYNLPEVVQADTVYLCEGEKDVATIQAFLRERNLPGAATTNAAGAGNLTKDHVRWLFGKRVIDVSDDDDAGSKRTKLLLKYLYELRNEGVVKSVTKWNGQLGRKEE